MGNTSGLIQRIKLPFRTHLHRLFQNPAADGTQQVLVHFPLETGDVVAHGTLPEPNLQGKGGFVSYTGITLP